MEIPSFIEIALSYNIPVTLSIDENKNIFFELPGFYKSGTVSIKNVDGKWVMFDRYGEVGRVNDFSSIAKANHEWWKRSRNRNEHWKNPDPLWIKPLLVYKFIEESPEPVYVDKR